MLPWQGLVVHFALPMASELRRSETGIREIGQRSSPLRQVLLITSCCLEPFAVSTHLLRLVASNVFCYPAVKRLTPPLLRIEVVSNRHKIRHCDVLAGPCGPSHFRSAFRDSVIGGGDGARHLASYGSKQTDDLDPFN